MTDARAVALRARPAAVAGALAALVPTLPMVFGPPALAATIEGAWPLAAALGLVAVPALALWTALRLRGARPPADLRGVEALLAVSLTFPLGALAAAPAFWALGMAPLDALFEAVSAMTTTGFSMAERAEAWPLSGHFLRAWVQWCAGLAFLAAALALVAGPGVVARRLGVAGLGRDQDLLTSTRARARALLGFYAAATAVAAVAAALTASNPIEGVFLALSAVSTAGFSPAPDSLAGESRALQAAVIGACLLGAVSFPLMLGARRAGLRRVWRDPALRLFLTTLVGGVAMVMAIEGARRGWDAGTLIDAAVQTASAATTAGFSSAPPAAMAPAALVVMIALMAMGGDVGSTAGGLKATRVAAAYAALRLTLIRAQAPPGAVTHLQALDSRFRGDEVAAILALAATYAASAGALWIALLLCDRPALPALFDAVSALSTVGLSAGAIAPGLSDAGKAAAIAGMLLGRVEFFALIALLRPATWRGAVDKGGQPTPRPRRRGRA